MKSAFENFELNLHYKNEQIIIIIIINYYNYYNIWEVIVAFKGNLHFNKKITLNHRK